MVVRHDGDGVAAAVLHVVRDGESRGTDKKWQGEGDEYSEDGAPVLNQIRVTPRLLDWRMRCARIVKSWNRCEVRLGGLWAAEEKGKCECREELERCQRSSWIK
jgi:hypothetical protein